MEWYYILLIVLASISCLLALVVYIFIKPGNPKKCYNYDWMYKNPIAHRGYYNNSNGVIENSKTAFELAIKNNYNIEMDISLTKDEEIIVYHDDDFKRLLKVDKKVSEMTLEEIKQLRYENSSDDILTFKEFLELIDGKTGLVIEYKSQNKKRNYILCEKSMELLKDYKGNYVVQSFDPIIVGWFKKNYPIIPRGQLCMIFDYKKTKEEAKGKGKKGLILRLNRWLYNNKLTNIVGRPLFLDHSHNDINFMGKLCHLFMPMIVYTVQTKEHYDAIYNKVDNIIFENLDLDENGKFRK